MKIVRVTYTTRAEYAEHNQTNIKAVMADLQILNRSGLNYHACLSPDGKTFTHLAFIATDEDNKALVELPSFIRFQQELKASGLETPPKQELLNLVGSSTPIFKS